MNNLIKESLIQLKSKLIPNPELDLRVLLSNCSNNKKEIIISNVDEKNIDIKKFKFFLQRRLNNEPISKIINKKSFWKYNFFVNSNVLDPRPETELIIEEAIILQGYNTDTIEILDIGTGSGCLAISLAKEVPNSKVTAIDISKTAIEVTKKNINIHSCNKQVKAKHTDILNINQKFDLIVSNPPYLSSAQYENTSSEIRKFEPKIAFFGGNDGLKFYRKFSRELPKIMKSNAYLILEIGENQLNACLEIFNLSGFKLVKKRKDLQKKDRILIFSRV